MRSYETTVRAIEASHTACKCFDDILDLIRGCLEKKNVRVFIYIAPVLLRGAVAVTVVFIRRISLLNPFRTALQFGGLLEFRLKCFAY